MPKFNHTNNNINYKFLNRFKIRRINNTPIGEIKQDTEKILNPNKGKKNRKKTQRTHDTNRKLNHINNYIKYDWPKNSHLKSKDCQIRFF